MFQLNQSSCFQSSPNIIQQQDILLNAVEIEEDHSGINIGDHLIEIIDNFDIRDKIRTEEAMPPCAPIKRQRTHVVALMKM